MRNQFRIVEKKTGAIMYFESIEGANKAKMVERCNKFLSRHTITTDKEMVVEFSKLDWNSKDNNHIGYSDYVHPWKCTTVVSLKRMADGRHYEIGEHLAGRKLNPESKAKGGTFGEMMIEMGI